MGNTTTSRNASLQDLADLLRDQESRKHDVVVPADKIRAKNGNIVITGAEKEISLDGVSNVDGVYTPTRHADGQIAAKLDITPTYLARCRESAVDLYDNNVNGWLRGKSVRRASGEVDVLRPADQRTFLARTFSNGDGTGVLRALLSDRFGVIDNFDVLTAALKAVHESGTEVEIRECSLSENNMYVDIFAPAVHAVADVLLKGYRNPFDDPTVAAQRKTNGNEFERWQEIARREGKGYEPGSEPVLHAGFRISNCEVGGGAFSIAPKLLVRVCKNGLVIKADQIRAVHLGSKMDQGIIEWSQKTRDLQLELVTSKATDAIKQFLNRDYLVAKIAEIEGKATKQIDKPVEVLQSVGKTLGFSKSETDGILSHFIKGGQSNAGGLLNAVTSYSQTVADPDRADTLDELAMKALELV